MSASQAERVARVALTRAGEPGDPRIAAMLAHAGAEETVAYLRTRSPVDEWGEAVHAVGVRIRAGLHTGEVIRSEGDLSGLAVHIGARVSALAAADEVLVTRTVKDLALGSTLAFEDAGVHRLKGVPEEWQLYRVVA